MSSLRRWFWNPWRKGERKTHLLNPRQCAHRFHGTGEVPAHTQNADLCALREIPPRDTWECRKTFPGHFEGPRVSSSNVEFLTRPHLYTNRTRIGSQSQLWHQRIARATRCGGGSKRKWSQQRRWTNVEEGADAQHDADGTKVDGGANDHLNADGSHMPRFSRRQLMQWYVQTRPKDGRSKTL